MKRQSKLILAMIIISEFCMAMAVMVRIRMKKMMTSNIAMAGTIMPLAQERATHRSATGGLPPGIIGLHLFERA